jgi:uncharacterized membrane protein YkvA (DUF1232 family)
MTIEQHEALEVANTGTLADIVAIIESAKARGGREALEKHIAKALPDASPAEVREAADVATEVIDSIPILLARARQEAGERGLNSVIIPLLEHAENYFLKPVDLIPEMTHGLAGLLDDSYLIIRLLQNLERGPHKFLDWDLDYPIRFLQRLIGGQVSQRLDRMAMEAMDEVSTHLSELWHRIAHRA